MSPRRWDPAFIETDTHMFESYCIHNFISFQWCCLSWRSKLRSFRQSKIWNSNMLNYKVLLRNFVIQVVDYNPSFLPTLILIEVITTQWMAVPGCTWDTWLKVQFFLLNPFTFNEYYIQFKLSYTFEIFDYVSIYDKFQYIVAKLPPTTPEVTRPPCGGNPPNYPQTGWMLPKMVNFHEILPTITYFAKERPRRALSSNFQYYNFVCHIVFYVYYLYYMLCVNFSNNIPQKAYEN